MAEVREGVTGADSPGEALQSPGTFPSLELGCPRRPWRLSEVSGTRSLPLPGRQGSVRSLGWDIRGGGWAGPGLSLRAPGVEGQLGAHHGTQPTGGAGQPQVVRLSCRRRAA